MIRIRLSSSRRAAFCLAVAALAAVCTAPSHVAAQALADVKGQPLRVQSSFKPAKLMVTVSGPGSRVAPAQAAEAEQLAQAFAEQLAADFATRFGDDAQAAGLTVLPGHPADPAPTLTLSVPLATVSFQLPGALHYRGGRPFVSFNVLARLADASGREVWSREVGTVAAPDTAPPEVRDRVGYRLMRYGLFKAMQAGGLLPPPAATESRP